MRITGTVVIDLTRIKLDSNDAASTARGAVWYAVADTPPGADVLLIVPPWDWWCQHAASTVIECGWHVSSVTVQCTDAATVGRWVCLLRDEARAAESAIEG